MAERGKTKLAEKLAKSNFDAQTLQMGQNRMIDQQFIRGAVGQFDPEIITVPRLHMLRRDPMIRMGLYYTKAPMYRMKWRAESEDKQLAAATDEAIRKVWANYLKTGLVSLDFGYQGAVKRWKMGQLDGKYEREDGEPVPIWGDANFSPVMPDTLIPLPPEYTRAKLNSKTGKFEGITSSIWPLDNHKDRTIPVEHALWWVNEYEETWNNWYGYPLTGPAYRYWWSYWFRHHMEDLHFEQDADPSLQVWYPPGDAQIDGETISHKDIALQIGSDLRGGGTIAWPSDVHKDETGKPTSVPLWRAEFLKGGENLAAFTASSERLDIMKLRAMLVPEQALIEGIQGTGARATSNVHADMYAKSLEQRGDDVLAMFNEYVIPQFVEANWGPDKPAVRLIQEGFDQEDLEFAQSLIEAAFSMDPNALPIDFDALLKQSKLPTYTPAEQREREEQAEQEAMERELEAQQQLEESVPTQPDANAAAGINASGQYHPVREKLFLAGTRSKTKGGKPVDSPEAEINRRAQNTAVFTERIQATSQRRYEALFAAAAGYLASQESIGAAAGTTGATVGAAASSVGGLELLVAAILARMKGFIAEETVLFDRNIRAELASLYHAVGSSELARLGLDTNSWDVGREEVQGWADEHAGELIQSMDSTVVDQHLRPFLAKELQLSLDTEPKKRGMRRRSAADTSHQGVSGEPIDLAQRITDKFSNYPLWMAKRVARSEARVGYNEAALDMWDVIGIEEVQAYDGLGGESGQTDAVCLARNGEIYDIEEARKENKKEHPNGTLGFFPIIPDKISLKPPKREPALLAAQPVYAELPYIITEGGQVLGMAETVKVLERSRRR